MREGSIDIPNHKTLQSEMLNMKFDISKTTQKVQIIDPENKSPDFADCLVYFIWKADLEVSWFFA